jgi:hypothetical protein
VPRSLLERLPRSDRQRRWRLSSPDRGNNCQRQWRSPDHAVLRLRSHRPTATSSTQAPRTTVQRA